MKRFLLIGSLAFAAASHVPMDAAAQDIIRRPGMLARSPSYSSLVSAIAATASATAKVSSRSVTAADIRVVEAGTVIGSDSEAPVRAALDRHKEHLAVLRLAVRGRQPYAQALAAHKDNPTANDVIAVDILDEGDVIVYFRRSPQ